MKTTTKTCRSDSTSTEPVTCGAADCSRCSSKVKFWPQEIDGLSFFFFFSFQNFLRCQNNKTNYNLVCETLQFLDIMCGSTTGGLGLLGLYINESNVHLITQTLETLTEYCQGPCQENQVSRAGRERVRPAVHSAPAARTLTSSLCLVRCRRV